MPIPLPTPASRPQAKSVPVGSPGTKRASTIVARAAPKHAVKATGQTDVRREATPPMKSERP